MLYHYTSQNGIIGIVQNCSVWATHTMFLNDSSEFIHSLSFAKRVAMKIFMEDDYLGAFGWALRHALETISADNLYVASFSEKPDLLSQWRGYCSQGAGFCIGFDIGTLKEFCDARGYRLAKCIYEHENQMEEIGKLVHSCLERFPKPHVSRNEYNALSTQEQARFEINYQMRTAAGPDKAQADAAIAWFCEQIVEVAPLFKNRGFHEEAEWRIVVKSPKEPVRFRASSSYLAPYVELQILAEPNRKALLEVIVGPNPNQSRCASSVKMLLASHGLEYVTVKCSPLPYNNW